MSSVSYTERKAGLLDWAGQVSVAGKRSFTKRKRRLTGGDSRTAETKSQTAISGTRPEGE